MTSVQVVCNYSIMTLVSTPDCLEDCMLCFNGTCTFRCQQIQFQVANVLADMVEMKLKEQEQESTPLSRGLQLFMRAKAGLGKKTTP